MQQRINLGMLVNAVAIATNVSWLTLRAARR